MDDLRHRRHLETREALFRAALTLFERHGFHAVTMEQIAEAAGVSRRTAYRRYTSKEDVILELPRRWLDVWDDTVEALGDSVPARSIVEHAAVAISMYIDEHRAETLLGQRILAEAPGLGAASVSNDAWHHRMLEQLHRDPVADGLDESALVVIAGAYLGAINAMLAQWSAAGATDALAGRTRDLVDRLAPIWPG